MFETGDVVLANVMYTDSFQVKERPALVLFEERGNIVLAAITSNLKMQGVLIKKEEGIRENSILKLNHIFTTTDEFIKSKLFTLSETKQKQIFMELVKRIQSLNYGN